VGTTFHTLLKNPFLEKIAFALFLLVLAVTIFLFIASFQQTQGVLMESTRNEGLSSALLAAQLVDGDAMAALHAGDEQTARYVSVYNTLNRIRRANPDIYYIYSMKRENGGIVFVVDADYRNPEATIPGAAIGEIYSNVTPAMLNGFYTPTPEPDFTTDQWGTVYSTFAPVYNSRGEGVGIIGVDLNANTLASRMMTLKMLYLVVLLVTFALALSVAVFVATMQEQTFRVVEENETYLKTIMQSIQAGVFIIDAETHLITDINPKALAMIGAQKEEVVGRPCHRFVCPAESGRCPITDLSQTVDNAERVLIDAKGRKIPIIKSVNSVAIGGRRLLIESFVDIRDRKVMEEKNARLIRELEMANTELKDFAYVVSHDLKAPLRAIGSLSQWLAADYREKIDENGRAQMDLLTSRVERMQNLIEGILAYSRVGRVREQKDDVSLDAVVREVTDSLFVPPHIAVSVDTPLPDVRYEKTRLHQIVSNLVGNAIKYMDKAAGEVHIACTREGAFWKLSVRDNGPGIESRHFKKIFQIFQTLQPRDKVESTGIGLTIVKKIVEMNGGRIWVESEVGNGSVFYVTIPISNPEEGST
jgi:two-component system, LuxR family, sensor kinase FixL